MTAARQLIVNADDFGQSAGINRGIVEAHEKGIVTSASFMVRWPAAIEAAEYGCRSNTLSIGIHFDFGEWTFRNDQWLPRYEVVRLDDSEAVSKEVERQLGEFRRLLGRDPTHLDSHQHVHRSGPLRSVLQDVAGDLRVPLRHFTPSIRYCGEFYGQGSRGESLQDAISVARLVQLVKGIPAGITELACHPGYVSADDSMYAGSRSIEIESLCDASVRKTIEDAEIELIGFRDVKL